MQLSRSVFLVLLCLFIFSCNRYKTYKSNYLFKSENGLPDYSNLDYWAAHPFKWDPSDSTPRPLVTEIKDSTVDVFFLHPTSLTDSKRTEQNAPIDDWQINVKTDYTSILYQASVFNKECRVFAPRYRQAHIRNFFLKDTMASRKAFETAYADIRNAFEYYLSHFNNGRPIIIASHSQGSLMAEQLLKDFFQDSPLKNKLVVAYIAGWPLAKNYFTSLKMCEDSLQTGCLCSWRTLRKGYVPSYFRNENESSYATNPLTWSTSTGYASKHMNDGSVLTKFNKIYKNTTDAQVSNGFLYVEKPKFPWSFLYFTKNYHAGDINLFYINIRENIRQRIGAFWKR